MHLPTRITQRWIEDTVPSLGAAELEAVLAAMRQRGWSERDLIERVYPFVASKPETASQPETSSASSASITRLRCTGVQAQRGYKRYFLGLGRRVHPHQRVTIRYRNPTPPPPERVWTFEVQGHWQLPLRSGDEFSVVRESGKVRGIRNHTTGTLWRFPGGVGNAVRRTLRELAAEK